MVAIYLAGKALKIAVFSTAVLTCASVTLYGIGTYLAPWATAPICGLILGTFATTAGGGDWIAAWTLYKGSI